MGMHSQFFALYPFVRETVRDARAWWMLAFRPFVNTPMMRGILQHDLRTQLHLELGIPALRCHALVSTFGNSALLVSATAAGPTSRTESQLQGIEVNLPVMKAVELVIHFRHVKQIGRLITTLGIKIGLATNSPCCCRDMTKLGFGRNAVRDNLFFSINPNARQANSRRQVLSTLPPYRTNALIVSHTANLRKVAGVWPKPEEGSAHAFQLLLEDCFRALPFVLPEDLAVTARRK